MRLGRTAFEEAIRIHPEEREPHLGLLTLLERAGLKAEANRKLDELTRRFPDDKEILVRNGVGCIKRGAHVKAVRFLERARALDPLDEEARVQIAVAYGAPTSFLERLRKKYGAGWAAAPAEALPEMAEVLAFSSRVEEQGPGRFAFEIDLLKRAVRRAMRGPIATGDAGRLFKALAVFEDSKGGLTAALVRKMTRDFPDDPHFEFLQMIQENSAWIHRPPTPGEFARMERIQRKALERGDGALAARISTMIHQLQQLMGILGDLLPEDLQDAEDMDDADFWDVGRDDLDDEGEPEEDTGEESSRDAGGEREAGLDPDFVQLLRNAGKILLKAGRRRKKPRRKTARSKPKPPPAPDPKQREDSGSVLRQLNLFDDDTEGL